MSCLSLFFFPSIYSTLVCRPFHLQSQAHLKSLDPTPGVVLLAPYRSILGWRRFLRLFDLHSFVSGHPVVGADGWFCPPLSSLFYSLRTRLPVSFLGIECDPLFWTLGGVFQVAATASAWLPLGKFIPKAFHLNQH